MLDAARAEPAGAPVEQEEREADDDRRERERQVDERVHEPLAGEAPADDREAAEDAEDRVQRHGDRGHLERHLEGVHRVGVARSPPRRRRASLRTSARRSARAARAGSTTQVAERDRRGGRAYGTFMPRREAPDAADERAGRRTRSRAGRPRQPRPPAGRRSGSRLKMKTDATSVRYGRLPEISTIAPISPTARANAIVTPERMPGQDVRQDDPAERRELARAERARRLLHLAVELDQHRLHRPHDERQRHEQQREEDRRAGEGEVDADRRVRPVEREQQQARRRSSAARTAGR